MPFMPPTQNDHTPTAAAAARSSLHVNTPTSTSTSNVSSLLASPPPSTCQTPVSPSSPSPPQKQTVIIFDWDDTLLASSYLSGRGYRLDSNLEMGPSAAPSQPLPPGTVMESPHEIITQLRELEQSVCNILQHAIASGGEVHVITNAETGWVQLSAAKFLPGVLPYLDQIQVLSARSTYEGMFPESPLKWKFYAFQDRLATAFDLMPNNGNNNHSNSPTPMCERHVISFGDSHVEREAVRAVTRGFINTRTKSVKFAERPSLEQLRRQLELVASCFRYIHNHDADLDLQLTVTVNPVNNNTTAANTNANNNGTGATNGVNNVTSDNDPISDTGKEIRDSGSAASANMMHPQQQAVRS